MVARVLAMPRQELLGRIAHDHLQPVPDGRSLYPQLWALADAPDFGLRTAPSRSDQIFASKGR